MDFRIPDKLGWLGIILTIVLLVLDKAGKLKGAWLYGLLILAGAMTLPIAVGNDWVLDAPARWKLRRGVLMVALVALTYSGMALLISGGTEEGGGPEKIVGHPEFLFSGAYPGVNGKPEQLVVITGCSIDNHTGYKTGLTDWKVILKFQDGHTVEGSAPLASDGDIALPLVDENNRPMSLRAVDYLPTKTMEPIPPGGATYGWYRAVFRGLTRSDVRGRGITVVASFTEIATTKGHLVEWEMDAPGRKVPGLYRVPK
jgi:hypothetical protein